MTIDTRDEVISLLRAGRSSEIIGAEESPTLEFKAEPYRLDAQRQRQELAKDISALANARGGAIAIGFKTHKEAGRATDAVLELRPFPRTMFDEERWRKVADEWVYPPIENIGIEWFAAAEDKGFAVLTIPEQRASTKPFLVTRSVSELDRVDGVVFGLFERRHTDAAPLSVAEVQSILRDGRVFRAAIDLRAADTTPSSSLVVPSGSSSVPPESVERTLKRAVRLIELMHLSEHPTYALTATPHPPLPARSMFERADHSVVKLLQRPPEIRSSGFDMNTGIDPEIVGGESRRSFVEGYKGKELWHDGTLVFVATADADFLSWGDRTPDAPLVINQVTLIESVLLFVDLYSKIWKELGSPETRVEFAIHLVRLCPDGKPPVLRPGGLGTHYFRANAAPSCEFHQQETASNPFDPPLIAYSLVARLYEWFGYEHDRIPYAQANRINPDAIAVI